MPSSVISWFSYDALKRELKVRFVSGRRYVYFDVPPQVYAGLRAARSKGEFYNAHIRDTYRHEKLS